DPAQSLHVNAGMGLWAGEQEEQAHGLSVDRLVGNRGWRRTGHPHTAGQCGTATVRPRHPITDPGRELALAFEDRPQNLVGLRRTYPTPPACPRAPRAPRRTPVSGKHQSHQFPQDPLLVASLEGYPDATG